MRCTEMDKMKDKHSVLRIKIYRFKTHDNNKNCSNNLNKIDFKLR